MFKCNDTISVCWAGEQLDFSWFRLNPFGAFWVSERYFAKTHFMSWSENISQNVFPYDDSFLCLSELWINPEQSHPEFPSAVQKRRHFDAGWSWQTSVKQKLLKQHWDVFPERFHPQSRCSIKHEWNMLVWFTTWDVNVQLLCCLHTCSDTKWT